MTQFTVDSSDHAPSLLAGRYLLGAEVGRGGMAVVYRARDSRLNRDVAVKMLRGVLLDPTARDRFTVEGQTLARLSHPGLISMFDAGTQDDSPYLVMELVDGETLNDYYQQYHMDAEQVCAIGAELADALAYVHDCGIVHRDVKPSNILLGDDGRVRLADFGIARMVADAGRQTATGLTMGTAAYLSPEQVREERITGAADVYALGLVLLESLTGEPAFSGPQNVVALARLMSPPRIDASIPPALRELLTQMTRSRPEIRPGAAEVADRLRAMAATGLALAPVAPVAPVPGQVPAQVPAQVPRQAQTQPIPRVDGVGTGGAVTGGAGTSGPGNSGRPTDPQAADWVGMRPTPRPRRNLALVLAAVLAVSVVPVWLLTARFTHHPVQGGNPPVGAPALPGAVDPPGKTTAGSPKVNPKKTRPLEAQQVIGPAQTKTTEPPETTATATVPAAGLPASTPSVDPSTGVSPLPSASPTKQTLKQVLEQLRKLREARRKARHKHKRGKN